MATPANLLWVKNVKRNKGEDWAYENYSFKKTGNILNFSTARGSLNPSHPKIGDLILIFQRVSEINGKKNNRVFLTHIVTPRTNDVKVDTNNVKFKWYRDVTVIAKALPIDGIPKPSFLDFGKVKWGLVYGIEHLVTDKMNLKTVQDTIWNLFRNQFNPIIKNEVFGNNFLIGEQGQIEGDKVPRKHLTYESTHRNSKKVLEKKAEALLKGNGRIKCECCNFDFVESFGVHGKEFIECHHNIFLSTGVRPTFLADLSLVCSNCHRMLHRRKPDKTYYTVKELKILIHKNIKLK